jgi:uncharacterized repeat protein (TIGR01451 family)
MGRMGRNGRRARRTRYGYGSLTHRLRLAVLAVPIMVLSQIAIFPAGQVRAVDATGQFCMDGQIEPGAPSTCLGAPPYHWSNLFDSGGNPVTPKPANMLASAFVPDYATPDNTYFVSGKDKDPISGGGWACTPVNTPTPKDDIQNTYAAVFKIPPTALENANHTVVYMGIERLSHNGDSFAGFWLLKDPTVGCSGTNNFTGKHTNGDTLILTNFTNGGGTANVSVYQWNGGDTGSLSTVALANGNVCGVSPGGTGGETICAISNAITIASTWTPTSHDSNTFTEAAVDLTTLFGGSASGPCFSNFLGETRSSQEITADRKDFAGGLLNTCTKPPVTTVASGHGSTQFPGSAQHDTATIAGTPTPTGTATFFLCSPTQTTSAGCPSGAGTQVGSPVTLSGGTATSTPDVTGATTPNDLAVGTYCWGAQYTPDTNSENVYLPSYGTDNTNECFTVAKAAPTMATQANFASGSGDLSSHPVLSDTATLTNVHTGTGGAPAGETVNISLFGPFAGGVTPSCGGTPLFTSTGTLSGSGTTYTATSGTHAVTATGTYVWTASYAGDAFNNSATEGCNGTNESQTISTPLLSITKVADKTTVSAGDGIGFIITVTNSSAAGTGNATGVALSDPLPAGTGINWSIASQTGTACPALATPPTQTLSCSIGTLTPGQSYTVHVTSGTTASSCATYPNTATASATNQTAGNVTASASTTVDCPNVSVLKTPDHDTVNAGSAIGFTVTVSNSGAAGTGTARSVTLTDDLPAGSGVNWSISPAYTGPGTCTITGPVGSQVLGCSFGDMAPGASASVHITSATAFASCATYQNTASVGVTNENGSPFTSTASTTVQCPGLGITKTADATPVSTGTSIGFTVTVSNAGPGTATAVTLNDPLPAGSGVDWMISPAYTGPGSCSITGPVGTQVLGCSFGDMANGASIPIHISSVTTSASAGTYPNTATASSANAPSVNASATIVVLAPNMMVAKTTDHATVSAGSAIGFTVTITNPGNSTNTGTATSVSLTDPLPAGTGVSWSIDTQSGSACSITGTVPTQSLSCSFTSFAPGASYSVHITSGTAFASCATYPNTATVGASNQTGTVHSSVSTTVQCPGLGITKTADATPVSTGTSIGFTVTVSNAGPGTATAVTLNDPLPAGSGVDWMISPAYTGPGSCSITGPVGTQVLGCSFGDMANGASIPIHISSVTTSASAGTYPNTATASSANAPSVNASATIVVLAPNMMVAKTTDHATVSAGSAIGFTVTITNPGNSTNTGTATSVSLTDPLPAGTGVSWSIDTQSGSACSITGTVPTQSLSCSFTSFAPGASYSVHITSGTAFASCATYPNTATVGASNQTGTVHSSVSTTVQCPGLGITKTADATPVSTGTSIGFTVTVSNAGPGTATAVTVNDPLPAGSGVNWSIASQTASACSITGPVGTQVLGCTLGDMAASASYTVHITSPTTSASAGTYPNTATASSTNAPSVNASATIVVLAPALSITKTADATPVSTGTSIGFTVTVSNSDASNTGTATSVTLNDPLPAGSGIDWTISPAYTGPGTCSIAGAVGSQTLSCSFGDMAPGASASVHISSVTTAASAGTYPNTATASAGNAPSVNASATIVVLAPNMTVAKTADNATVSAGSAIGFTVTISNPGNSTNTGTATGVSLTDPLPAGTDVVWSIDSQDGTACSITGTAPSQSLSCSFTRFAPGASYDVHVTSRTAFASCADYTNTATVGASNQTGTVSATASTTVQCPTLAITKTADATPVSEGTPIGFVVKVTNGGPGTATGVMVNDPLPAGTGVVWSIASQTASACSITGTAPTQTLVCSIGDMTAESSYTVHITSPTTAGSAGTYPNTATVSATNAPSGSATATITVQAPALAITKTADSASVTSGDAVGFTVTVSNSDSSGTGTATAVTLNDPLPSGSGVDWSISPAYTGPGTCTITGAAGSQTLTCSFGDMAPGATASVHVTSATTSNVTCSPLSNTATASAGNAASLQASATITVACGGVLSIVTPSTGWGSLLWAAIPLVGSGFMLLLFAAMGRRRRRMPDA